MKILDEILVDQVPKLFITMLVHRYILTHPTTSQMRLYAFSSVHAMQGSTRVSDNKNFCKKI